MEMQNRTNRQTKINAVLEQYTLANPNRGIPIHKTFVPISEICNINSMENHITKIWMVQTDSSG